MAANASSVTLVLDVKAELGEGPIWDSRRQRLLFVDIMRGHVHEFDPSTGQDRVFEVGEPVGAVGLSDRGDWVLAAGRGFSRLDPTTGRVSRIAEAALPGTDVRMNDGYVDALGRFWAGTMSLVGQPGQGVLYRLDPDGAVHAMLAPVTTSNGIDWSPDGTRMYYIDTPTLSIDVFDFDAGRGAIGNRRTFVKAGPTDGRPDGLVVDELGGVWVAFWGGGAVRRYTPAGQLDHAIALPVTLTTKCAFGGPDLADLYITSASSKLTSEECVGQPHAGGLFRVSPGVRGKAPHRFAG